MDSGEQSDSLVSVGLHDVLVCAVVGFASKTAAHAAHIDLETNIFAISDANQKSKMQSNNEKGGKKKKKKKK